MSESQPSEHAAAATAELARLRAALRTYEVRTEHQIADALVVALGDDVATQAEATLALLSSSVPQAGAANARAAFEAGQDLLFLASDRSAFDVSGATAYALELLEQQRLRERGVSAGVSLGVDTSAAGTAAAADVVEQEAKRLDADAPGRGAELRAALSRVTANERGFRHWSGMGRAQMMRTAAEAWPEARDLTVAADALYGSASVRAHPRLRSLDRRFGRDADGKIAISYQRDTRLFVIRLARIALAFAGEALERVVAWRASE